MQIIKLNHFKDLPEISLKSINATNHSVKAKPDPDVDMKALEYLLLQNEREIQDLEVTIKEEIEEPKLETSLDVALPVANSDILIPRSVRFDVPTDPVSQPENNRFLKYFCQTCHVKTEDYRNNLKHHLLFHGRKRSQKQIINFWVEPDIGDENFSCSACARKYANLQAFRRHLTDVHFLVLPKSGTKKGRPTKKSKRKSAPPFRKELDKANSFCRDCDKFFPTAALLTHHLSVLHKEKLIRNANELPEWKNPDNYCRSCEVDFVSVPAFRRHCQSVHKMNSKGPILPSKEPNLPDPFDSNHYCQVCDKVSANLKTFRYHCRYVHHMDLTPTTMGTEAKPDLTPDINDKQNHCQSCDKTYSSKHRYHVHLRLYHKLSVKKAQKEIKPDVDDPNHYCCSCQRTSKDRSSYRAHLRRAHHIYLTK